MDGSLWATLSALALCTVGGGCAASRRDPLPSWSDGPARDRITAFVERVTSPGPDFVAPDDRIAVFDNDGTL
jgi:hypothetical protein